MDKAIVLRPYQAACVDAMRQYTGDAALCVLATGLGKSVIFSAYIKIEAAVGHRVLLLSHRDELVRQPIKYLCNMDVGLEIASTHAHGEVVVSASVQTLVNRLADYNSREFDVIIIDEAHHAAAPTYRKILDYFDGAQVFGFTATARRGDGVGLNCVFQNIIFERNLLWGIQNKYLCPIECKQIDLKYKLESVKIVNGDYDKKGLAAAMSGTALGVAEIYGKYARGQTIIFGASVLEAKSIATEINKTAGHHIAATVFAGTQSRSGLLDAFCAGIIHVLVNYDVLTEGVDLPCTETIIIAQPVASANPARYAQFVGRGVRLYDGKDSCLVIDCVGISGTPICTAATLIGEPPKDAPPPTAPQAPKRPEPDKPLTVLQGKEIPDSWIKKTAEVDIAAKGEGVDAHGIAWTVMDDGSRVLTLGTTYYTITPPDTNGNVYLWRGHKRSKAAVTLQFVLDYVYQDCVDHRPAERYLWDSAQRHRWADARITDKQYQLICELAPEYHIDTKTMTRGDASTVIKILQYKIGGKMYYAKKSS